MDVPSASLAVREQRPPVCCLALHLNREAVMPASSQKLKRLNAVPVSIDDLWERVEDAPQSARDDRSDLIAALVRRFCR